MFMGAVGYLVHYRKNIVKSLLVPVVLVMIIDLLSYFIPDEWTLVGWALFAVIVLFYAVMAVTVHRLLILGPESVPEWGLPGLSARELRFASYVLGIMLIAWVVKLPMLLVVLLPAEKFDYLGIVSGFLFLWSMVAGFIVARFLLVFPGTAVDRDPSLKGSWSMTRPHVLMIFLVGVVVPELGGLLLSWLYTVPVIQHLGTLIAVVVLVFFVSLLSVAYRQIQASH